MEGLPFNRKSPFFLSPLLSLLHHVRLSRSSLPETSTMIDFSP